MDISTITFTVMRPENCLYLLEKFGLLSEEQKRYKEKMKVKQSSLRAFFD